MRILNSVLLSCCLVAVLALLIGSLPSYTGHQICDYNDATKHYDCPTYSLLPFIFIEIGKALNMYGAAISTLGTLAIAAFTGTLWWSTRGLWKVTDESIRDGARAADAASRSADASERSIQVSRELFVESNRPWLKIESVRLTDDIRKDVNGLRISAEFVVKNIGKSPAENILIHPYAYATLRNYVESARDLIDDYRRRTRPPWGPTVFPYDRLSEPIAFYITNTELKMVEREENNFLFPFFFCVINYFYGGSEGSHQTVATFELRQRDGRGIIADGIIPLANVVLFRPHTGAEIAN